MYASTEESEGSGARGHTVHYPDPHHGVGDDLQAQREPHGGRRMIGLKFQHPAVRIVARGENGAKISAPITLCVIGAL